MIRHTNQHTVLWNLGVLGNAKQPNTPKTRNFETLELWELVVLGSAKQPNTPKI